MTPPNESPGVQVISEYRKARSLMDSMGTPHPNSIWHRLFAEAEKANPCTTSLDCTLSLALQQNLEVSIQDRELLASRCQSQHPQLCRSDKVSIRKKGTGGMPVWRWWAFSSQKALHWYVAEKTVRMMLSTLAMQTKRLVSVLWLHPKTVSHGQTANPSLATIQKAA